MGETRRLRGMVFDLDGTLADTVPLCVAAFREAFERYTNRRWSDEEIEDLFGPTEEGSCRRAVPDAWKGCLETYLDAYERLHAGLTEPFPGIEEALGVLRERGVPVAVVTGKGPESARISLERLGLQRYFDVVEPGSPDGPVKPESLGRVLAGWNMEPREAAYVGDSGYDMRTASEVGMAALAASWARGSTARDAGPQVHLEAVLHDARDLLEWIKANVPGDRRR